MIWSVPFFLSVFRKTAPTNRSGFFSILYHHCEPVVNPCQPPAGNSRLRLRMPPSLVVDLGRIELPTQQCECRVMPLYYRPKYFHFSNFRIGSHFHKGRTRASVSGCVNGIELPCSCQSQYQPTYLLYHGKQGKSSDEGISTKKVPRSTASWGNNTVIGPEWDFTRTVHR